MRIIVTGCRDWTDELAVRGAIACQIALMAPFDEAVVVHGRCRSGADLAAESFCNEAGIPQERHPADWDRHGKAAGPIRNQAMVDAGADLVLAFWDGASRGTLDCLTRAVKAGIPVRIIPKQGPPPSKASE